MKTDYVQKKAKANRVLLWATGE